MRPSPASAVALGALLFLSILSSSAAAQAFPWTDDSGKSKLAAGTVGIINETVTPIMLTQSTLPASKTSASTGPASTTVASTIPASAKPAVTQRLAGSGPESLCPSKSQCMPFSGDVHPKAGLLESLAARTWNRELVLISEARMAPAYQAVEDFRRLGIDHVLWCVSSTCVCMSTRSLCVPSPRLVLTRTQCPLLLLMMIHDRAPGHCTYCGFLGLMTMALRPSSMTDANQGWLTAV